MAWFDVKKFGNRLCRSLVGRQGGEGILHWDDSGSWKDIVGAIPVSVPIASPGQNQIAFIAREASLLVAVEAVWATAESTAASCNLQIERLQGTEAPGSGDLLLAATACDVKGTANTVAAPAVVTTNDVHKLADGDRLAIEFALDNGTGVAPTELADLCVVLWYVPQRLPAATG